MSDPSAVDAAVIATLSGDPTLSALLPDGVFFGVSKPGATRFVVVSEVVREDTDAFTSTAYERVVYQIKAVALDSSGVDVKGAALRIHELMQRVPLVINGYAHMSTLRVRPFRYVEVDSIDADIRWQHCGGDYEIFVSPTESVNA